MSTECGVEKTEGQVTKQILRQGHLSNELREIVDKIEVRLANALQEAVESLDEQAKDKETLVSTARQIADNSTIVEDCIRRLTSILNRIEI